VPCGGRAVLVAEEQRIKETEVEKGVGRGRTRLVQGRNRLVQGSNRLGGRRNRLVGQRNKLGGQRNRLVGQRNRLVRCPHALVACPNTLVPRSKKLVSRASGGAGRVDRAAHRPVTLIPRPAERETLEHSNTPQAIDHPRSSSVRIGVHLTSASSVEPWLTLFQAKPSPSPAPRLRNV
jgi:hypothetical protein